MPAAKPSQSAVANVLAALKAQGLEVQGVKVDASGGFEVTTTAKPAATSDSGPKRFCAPT